MKIKTAIQKLGQDIKAMDLRAGVLSHAVIQHKVREKRNPDDVGIGGNIYYFDSFVKLISSY